MMKLRYGESFAKQSGSCWRLILVYALCPWLSKYRILTRQDTENGGADNATLQFISLRKVIRESMTLHGEGSTLKDNGEEDNGSNDQSNPEVAAGIEVAGDDKPDLTAEEENAQLKEEIINLKRRLKAMNSMRAARSGLLMRA